MDLDYSWFIPNLIFERVIINCLIANSFESRIDDNNINSSENSIEVFGTEELKYRKEEKLL